MYNFLRPYRKEKTEDQEMRADFYYIMGFIEKICNLYKVESPDIETKSYNILKYAFINGHCGLAKFDDGKYYVGAGTYAGELDADGYGKEYLITLQNGQTKQGTIGKDVVVLKWNNLAFSQFPQLQFYSDMLAKIDTSFKANIVYSRVCPIPIVENDTEQKSLEEVVKNLMAGKISIFKRQTRRGLHADMEDREKQMLELTNPQTSTYIQNLSRAYDEMIIRIMREFGVYVSERDKGAQLNDKELNAFKDYTAISSDDTFDRLKDFSKDCKEVFEIDVTVESKNFVYTNEDIANEEEYLNEEMEREEEENE